MGWLEDYEVFLFDFDGLLVDTEPLHFAAYQQMCENRGVAFPFDFSQFCVEAHGTAMGIWEALERKCPGLFTTESRREVLYGEKKQAYLDLLKKGTLQLMEGVDSFLSELLERGKRCAVVTNSPRDHVEIIKEGLPKLHAIPLWITRENYLNPKPAPDGYLEAMSRLHASQEKVIGFEDTLKGLSALLAAGVTGVLVCPSERAQVKLALEMGGLHIPSFSYTQ